MDNFEPDDKFHEQFLKQIGDIQDIILKDSKDGIITKKNAIDINDDLDVIKEDIEDILDIKTGGSRNNRRKKKYSKNIIKKMNGGYYFSKPAIKTIILIVVGVISAVLIFANLKDIKDICKLIIERFDSIWENCIFYIKQYSGCTTVQAQLSTKVVANATGYISSAMGMISSVNPWGAVAAKAIGDIGVITTHCTHYQQLSGLISKLILQDPKVMAGLCSGFSYVSMFRKKVEPTVLPDPKEDPSKNISTIDMWVNGLYDLMNTQAAINQQLEDELKNLELKKKLYLLEQENLIQTIKEKKIEVDVGIQSIVYSVDLIEDSTKTEQHNDYVSPIKSKKNPKSKEKKTKAKKSPKVAKEKKTRKVKKLSLSVLKSPTKKTHISP